VVRVVLGHFGDAMCLVRLDVERKRRRRWSRRAMKGVVEVIRKGKVHVHPRNVRWRCGGAACLIR
jgi:hypothetical protein